MTLWTRLHFHVTYVRMWDSRRRHVWSTCSPENIIQRKQTKEKKTDSKSWTFWFWVYLWNEASSLQPLPTGSSSVDEGRCPNLTLNYPQAQSRPTEKETQLLLNNKQTQLTARAENRYVRFTRSKLLGKLVCLSVPARKGALIKTQWIPVKWCCWCDVWGVAAVEKLFF